MAKTKRINKIKVICNSVMVITPILPQIAGKRGSQTACRCLLQAPSYESIAYPLKLCYAFSFLGQIIFYRLPRIGGNYLFLKRRFLLWNIFK
jgi:hypothetical protein